MAELKKFANRDDMGGGRDRRHDRHGGMLYPLLLAAAIAVIVFSIIGIATMTGVVPNGATRDAGGKQGAGERDRRPTRIEVPNAVPPHGNPRSVKNGAPWYSSHHA
ncbi:MAG: hypothetical protein ACT4P8_12860 [Betaproteobacteria bacterium]